MHQLFYTDKSVVFQLPCVQLILRISTKFKFFCPVPVLIGGTAEGAAVHGLGGVGGGWSGPAAQGPSPPPSDGCCALGGYQQVSTSQSREFGFKRDWVRS
jgi:hypothetical protein